MLVADFLVLSLDRLIRTVVAFMALLRASMSWSYRRRRRLLVCTPKQRLQIKLETLELLTKKSSIGKSRRQTRHRLFSVLVKPLEGVGAMTIKALSEFIVSLHERAKRRPVMILITKARIKGIGGECRNP